MSGEDTARVTGVRQWGGAASAAVLALALVVPGCAAEPRGPEEPGSELSAYLAEALGEFDPTAPDPRAVTAQELIAECMTDAGFEYFLEIDAVQVRYAGPPEPLTLDYAMEFGYAMTTEAYGPQIPPMSWDPSIVMNEGARQNEAYRSSLSTEALRQYMVALYGDNSSFSESFDPDGIDPPQDIGCEGRAGEEAYPGNPAMFEEVIQVTLRRYDEIEQDPRVTGAVSRWVDCMADAGYLGLVEPLDAQNLVVGLTNAFRESHRGVSTYEETKEAFPDDLVALQAAEIAVAVADATCQGESGYLETYAELMVEIDDRILETYREELDAWLAWEREQRAGG